MITLRVRLKSIMKHKKYQNKNNEDIYVLHFPGTGIIGHENIISENLDRPIQMDSNLSIISIMNQSCYDKSFIVKQCTYNNIPIFNTAINEQKWNNCMKINHILECLEQIKTDYVLILDGRDTLIVNDLDATFIEKYLSYKIPVVYNATPVPYPNAVVEPLQELLKISGTHKFLNAGICVGIKEALVEFYKQAKIINYKIYNNSSEQYIIRLTKEKNPSLAGIDNELKLFRIVHQYDTIIKENNNIVQLI